MLADRDQLAESQCGRRQSRRDLGSRRATVKIAFDPSTGLPARETYQQAGPGGVASIEEVFEDWRDVDGIKVPFKATIIQNGKKFGDAVVQEFKINTGLKPEELSQKP